jgi:hypothetical protein
MVLVTLERGATAAPCTTSLRREAVLELQEIPTLSIALGDAVIACDQTHRRVQHVAVNTFPPRTRQRPNTQKCSSTQTYAHKKEHLHP